MEKLACSFYSTHETSYKWFRYKKKLYYLAETLQITLLYIKTLSTNTGNLPNVPEKNENQQFSDIDTQENNGLQDTTIAITFNHL